MWIVLVILAAAALGLAAAAIGGRGGRRKPASQQEAPKRLREAFSMPAKAEKTNVFQWVYRDLDSESRWERATVKWFNSSMGFGCLSRGAGAEVVFVEAETMVASGFAELRPGQVLQVRYGREEDKLLALELRADAVEDGDPAPKKGGPVEKAVTPLGA